MRNLFNRFTTSFMIVAVLAAAAGAALLGQVDTARAATQTANLNFSGSGGNTSILSALAVCDECAPDAFFNDPNGFINTWGFGVGANITAQASWNNPAPVSLQYTAANLRHGATLDLSDTLTPGAGTIGVNYSVTGIIGLYGSPQTGNLSCAVLTVTPSTCNGWVPTTDTLTLGPISGSDNIPCTMPLPGESPRDCSNTKTITLWNANLFDFVDVTVNLILDEQVTVTGSGVTSLRIAVINGGPAIANKTLSFGGTSPSTVSDPIAIDCSQPVGNDLMYSLTNNSYAAEPATYTGDVKLSVSASAFGIGGTYTTPALVTSSGADLGPIALSAPDQQVDLGPVQKNNVPPTVNANGPYTGVEGSPVTFDSTGTSGVCGFPTLVWNFSDGGVAYGPSPQHTFEAPGVYSGLLTATDADGNVATTTFSVTISNLPPVATAGPNMSSEWGVPVTLNGAAVDPGTDEQPFLTYSWDFGDGSPSASGGASVTHTYAGPGTYTATLTACDPESACGTSTTQVVVVPRGTTLVYTGPVQALPSKRVGLTATLTDDRGQPVVGATVTFTLGSQTVTGVTNSSGVATASLVLMQKPGTYPLAASFAGTAKYLASAAASGTFKIGAR